MHIASLTALRDHPKVKTADFDFKFGSYVVVFRSDHVVNYTSGEIESYKKNEIHAMLDRHYVGEGEIMVQAKGPVDILLDLAADKNVVPETRLQACIALLQYAPAG